MTQLTIDRRDALYVARQPILDTAGVVFWYELLYRAGAGDTGCSASSDSASARVLSDAVLSLGLDTLAGGRPAFVNFTRSLLVNDVGLLLPPDMAVIELHEDIPGDCEVIEACRRLHAAGYMLALDDFVPGSGAEALLPYVRFVKVDVLATPATELAALAKWFRRPGLRLIVEKVETAEVFQQCRAAGYNLFQGYFFHRAINSGAAPLPARRLAYVRLLSALNRPNLQIADLETLVKQDVSLSYRVLRCINSAGFGLRQPIRSIRQALVMLGFDLIRKWASVWCIAGLNAGGSPELATNALVRARCSEMLGDGLSDTNERSELFLVGLCSLLDAILSQPMEEALSELSLSQDVRAALLGHPNTERFVLDAIVAYERGSWEAAIEHVRLAGVSERLLPAAYTDALEWARELSRTTGAV